MDSGLVSRSGSRVGLSLCSFLGFVEQGKINTEQQNEVVGLTDKQN